jgi:hypothetical protein
VFESLVGKVRGLGELLAGLATDRCIVARLNQLER